jgi:tRNA(Ile)-lysidine synthase
MAGLGPFGAVPRLAIGVSGGPDSTALALLAHDWAAERGGDIKAYVVDHGLRPDSAAEAALTAQRLAARGIATQILHLPTPIIPPAIQEKARAARHAALQAAAFADARLHLLLGHHADDQAETVTMRAARGPSGAEGMAAWSARAHIVLLRPLLGMRKVQLRDYCLAQAVEWVEDPSNRDRKFERVRVREGGGLAAPDDGGTRRARDAEMAAFLGRCVTFRPEGFAVADCETLPPAALAAVLRVVGGSIYPPRQDAVARLAANLRPATLGGVRVMRRRDGWYFCRERWAADISAHEGVIWDRRFRLDQAAPAGAMFGALAAAAMTLKFRKFNDLPFAVLRAMPCLRMQDGDILFPVQARFLPPGPAAGAEFFN